MGSGFHLVENSLDSSSMSKPSFDYNCLKKFIVLCLGLDFEALVRSTLKLLNSKGGVLGYASLSSTISPSSALLFF